MGIALYPLDIDNYELERETPQLGTRWRPWRYRGMAAGLPPLVVRETTEKDRAAWPLWLQEIDATHPVKWVMEVVDD